MAQRIQRHQFPILLDDGIVIATLSGNVSLDEDSQQILGYDPNGSNRTITLPSAISYRSGWWFVVKNTGTANSLAISDGSTIATLEAEEWGVFVTEGTDWYAFAVGGSSPSLSVDTISEYTAAAGVTIDGLRIKDGAVTPASGGTSVLDLSNIATGEGLVKLKDNLANAFEVIEGSASYLKFVTTNDAERVKVGKILDLTATTVDMADATHTLVLGTAGAAQTKLLGNIVYCDPNSTGTHEDLQMPAAASFVGEVTVVNTGDEVVRVLGASSAVLLQLDPDQHGRVVSDGTTLYGYGTQFAPGYLDGLEVAWATAATVTVGTGRCRSSDNKANIYVRAPLTANLAASGANGLDTGAEGNSTWYYVWVIQRADGTVASLLSLSSTAPTMPSGYVAKRLLGAVYNNSSGDLRAFVAYGAARDRTVIWNNGDGTDRVALAAGTDASYTDVSLAAHLPPLSTMAFLDGQTSTATTGASVRPNGSTLDPYTTFTSSVAYFGTQFWMPTDASQVIEYKRSAGAGTVAIVVVGYRVVV